MANLKDDPKHIAAVDKATAAGAKEATKKALAAIKAATIPEGKAEAKAVKAVLKEITAAIKA